MKTKISTITLLLLAMTGTAQAARKDCTDLKAEIDTQLQAKGVQNYTLEAVANDAVGAGKIVGSCDGGTQKLVYTRGSPASSVTPVAEPAAAEPTAPASDAPLPNY